MLKIKKGLINILEENRNNNEPEEAPQLQTPQYVQTQIMQTQAPQPQTPQHVQLQTVQPPAAQPPASAPRQAAAAEDWGDLLIKLLASAPEDVAQKLISCIDREVIAKALEKRNDPYLKVALLLISKK
jgi:hypothetical protein